MKKKPDFEIVNIADDYMLVPVGEQMESFNGTVIMNEVSAFILEKLKSDRTEEELVSLLTAEYDVDRGTAQADVHSALKKMRAIGIIYD